MNAITLHFIRRTGLLAGAVLVLACVRAYGADQAI